MGNNILSLSGGNQQKVLFARALGSKAGIVLMDDPMRGVDIGTKQEVYDMIRAEADRGRTFLWYTTEMDELANCDHVYVFRNGRIVAEPAPRRDVRGAGAAILLRGGRMTAGGFLSPRALRSLLPALSLVVLLAAIFWLQPRTMSYRGLDLMLNLAVPIALATMAQMCVMTVNDLDLGDRHLRRLRRLRGRDLARRDAGARDCSCSPAAWRSMRWWAR